MELKRVRSGREAVYVSRTDKARLVLVGGTATWTDGGTTVTCKLQLR